MRELRRGPLGKADESGRSRRGATRAALAALAAVVALFAAASWAFLRTTDEAPVDFARPEDATEAPSRAAVELADDAEDRRELAAAEVVRSDDASSRAETATTHAPIEIVVLDLASQAPVAGAEIRWVNVADLPTVDEQRPRQTIDPFDVPASAPRTTTDALGRATVDTLAFPGRITARRGTSSGWIYANASLARPLQLAIAPERGVAIEVVDAAGAPVAGVPVELRKLREHGPQGTFWRATTDERGLARYREFTSDMTSGIVFAALDVLAFDAPFADVDIAHLPSAPVRLVLPPCGSVTLSVRDTAGTPVTAVAASIARALPEPAEADPKRAEPATHLPERIAPGVVEFPFVGVGLDLLVEVRTHGGSRAERGRGPRSAGEAVRFELVAGPPVAVITGRVVDADARPLADRAMSASMVGQGVDAPAEAWRMRTDAEGRFRRETYAQVGRPLHAMLSWAPIGIGLGEGAREERLVELASAPELLDLGDVVVRAPRSIVAGIVVDDVGAPVLGAMLEVETFADGAWSRDARYEAHDRKDGHFVVQAVADPERLRIRATDQTFAPSEFVEIAVGDLDARIVLPRASEIVGRVVLDPGADPTLLEARLVGSRTDRDRSRPPVEVLRSKVSAAGDFALSGVRAGRYDVELGLRGAKRSLAIVDDVDAPPGARAADARLDAIDLRGLVPQ